MGRSHKRELFERHRDIATYWYNKAAEFHDVAMLIWNNKEGRVIGLWHACSFNAAMSIELMLKCICIRASKSFPRTHDLNKLAKHANIKFRDDEIFILEFLTQILIWAGRYPASNNQKQWDYFHDNVLENLEIPLRRSESGFVISKANPNRIINQENYERIYANIAQYALG